MPLLRSALVLSLLCALPATAAQGDPKVREAAQRGITFLARSTATWQKEHQCYGCHVQAVTLEGLAVGKQNQYNVPAKELGIILEGVLHSQGGARTAGGLSQNLFPRTARTFGSTSGMNFCPLNPGTTLITSTTSTSSSAGQTRSTGVAGLSVMPTLQPNLRIPRAV